jgi:hypothetical protein
MRRTASVSLVFASLLATACMNRLPDQDLRIRSAVPIAKMTAADLWQDYQRDRAAADGKYWGKPLEISGNVTAADAAGAASPALFFAQADQRGVRARLLDEDAAAILKVATAGQRITLHCFCEGLQTDVILKSCILK